MKIQKFMKLKFFLFKQKFDTVEITYKDYLDNLLDEIEFETDFNYVEEYRENALRFQLKAQRLLDNFKAKLSKGIICNVISVIKYRNGIRQLTDIKISFTKFEAH